MASDEVRRRALEAFATLYPSVNAKADAGEFRMRDLRMMFVEGYELCWMQTVPPGK